MRFRLPRPPLAAVVALVVAGPLAGPAAAQTTTSSTASSILICEATGNPSAPYVEISVTPDQLGNYSAAEGDIIPAPATGCPASAAGAAPTETSQTSTTSAVTSTATSTASATTSQRTHSSAASGTKGASTSQLAATNPITNTTTTSAAATETAAPLQTLPFTGGDVPTTIVLGLLLLYIGAVLRWATGGRGRRSGT